jgi:hypothetical protein
MVIEALRNQWRNFEPASFHTMLDVKMFTFEVFAERGRSTLTRINKGG